MIFMALFATANRARIGTRTMCFGLHVGLEEVECSKGRARTAARRDRISKLFRSLDLERIAFPS